MTHHVGVGSVPQRLQQPVVRGEDDCLGVFGQSQEESIVDDDPGLQSDLGGAGNLVINSPASVRSKAGRTNGLIERPLPDSYAAFELRGAGFPAIVIPPIRRKYFDEACTPCSDR